MKKQNRFKRISKTSAIICLIFCLIFSSIPNIADARSIGGTDYPDDMDVKLYYFAVMDCIPHLKDPNFRYGIQLNSITPSEFSANSIFQSNQTTVSGAYVETEEATKTNDFNGKLWCRGDGGKDGDTIVKLFTLANITTKEFFCDYKNSALNGAFKPGPAYSDYTCKMAFDDNVKFDYNWSVSTKASIGEYLTKLVAYKLYGSDDEKSVKKLKQGVDGHLENWFLNYESFTHGCISKLMSEKDKDDRASISIVDDSGTVPKVVKRYYIYRSGVTDGTKIILYKDESGEKKESCGELAKRLNPGNGVFDNYWQIFEGAAQTDIEINKKDCGNKIHDKIAKWEAALSNYKNRRNGGNSAATNLAALWLLAQGVTTKTYVTEIGQEVTPALAQVSQLTDPDTHHAYGMGTPSDMLYINLITSSIDAASTNITIDDNNLKLYDNVLVENVKKSTADLYNNTKYLGSEQKQAPNQAIIDAAKAVLSELKAQVDAIDADIVKLEKYVKQMSNSGPAIQEHVPGGGLVTIGYKPTVTQSGGDYIPADNLFYHIDSTTLADDEYGYKCDLDWPFRDKPSEIAITISSEPYNPHYSDIDPGDGGDNPYYGASSSDCYNGIGGTSWIVCSAGELGYHIGNPIWAAVKDWTGTHDSIVYQMVGRIDGQNTALFNAWATMRDIANLVFVLLFMVVVFSQLTGFGIDNYGIKKILPKLIVSAILINASFLICAIAIDVSNIIGSSLKSFFMSLNTDGIVYSETIWTFIGQFLGIATAGAAIGGGVYAISAIGWETVVSTIAPWFILALITMLITVLFAFIVLGFRQAMIVILVVLSPIAFACNILPNTEKIYKKWFDLFKAMLVVYPVVGLLIGAGNFTGDLMFNVGGKTTASVIVAAVLEVVPYFLVPSLSRKALGAIDGLGGKIQGFGKRLSGGLNNKISKSDAMEGVKGSLNQWAGRRFLNKRGADIENRLKGNTGTKRNFFGKKVSTSGVSNAELARYQRAKQAEHTNEQNMLKAQAAYYDGENFDPEAELNRIKVKAEAARFSNENIKSPAGFEAAMTAISRKERDTAVANYKSQIASDKGYGVDGINKYNMKGMEGLLRNSDTNEDLATAVAESMVEKDAGAAADRFTELLQDPGVSNDTKKAIAKAALSINGLKTKNTPLLKLANQTLGDDGLTNWKYDSFDIGGKISAETFSDIDKELLERQLKEAFKTHKEEGKIIIDGEENHAMVEKLQNTYKELAKRIAENPQVISKIKSEEQWTILQQAAPELDWKSIRGSVIKIDHPNDKPRQVGFVG